MPSPRKPVVERDRSLALETGVTTPSKAPARVPSTTRKTPMGRGAKRDWTKVDADLVNRGDVFLLFERSHLEELTQVGRAHRYPQALIDLANVLGVTFGLALRQREGFLRGLLRQMGVTSVNAPDHSTLSRRGNEVVLPRIERGGALYLSIDSTGISMHPGGSWNRHKHGGKVPTGWVKWHLGVDIETGEVVASDVTFNSGRGSGDASVGGPMVKGVGSYRELATVTADGAYDRLNMYQAAERVDADLLTPPRVDAAYGLHPARDVTMAQVGRIGEEDWRKRSGYSMRTFSEVWNNSLKTSFTDETRTRTLGGAHRELNYRAMTHNIWRAREAGVVGATPSWLL